MISFAEIIAFHAYAIIDVTAVFIGLFNFKLKLNQTLVTCQIQTERANARDVSNSNERAYAGDVSNSNRARENGKSDHIFD